MAEYVQWKNKNSYRSYPIADDSSFSTDSGDRIPDDVFLDALITPIDPVGTVYVSAINFPDNRLEVSDSTGVIAFASLKNEDLELSLTDSYGRNIGVIVVTESFYDLGGKLEFRAHALPFSPAAVLPQRQNCVRGIKLPDGTLLTGDVTIIGIDGIEVSLDGDYVRFDAVGTSDDPECIELPPPLKCMMVSQIGSGGLFAISVDGNDVNIDTAYQLEDLCEEKKLAKLPDVTGELPLRRKDLCDEVPDTPCGDPVPVTEVEVCGNSMRLVPISSLMGMEVGAEPGIPAYEGDGLNALPPRSLHVLKLYLRGINA